MAEHKKKQDRDSLRSPKTGYLIAKNMTLGISQAEKKCRSFADGGEGWHRLGYARFLTPTGLDVRVIAYISQVAPQVVPPLFFKGDGFGANIDAPQEKWENLVKQGGGVWALS